MFKLIPRENPSISQNTKSSGGKKVYVKLIKKAAVDDNTDKKVIKKVCVKLVNYVSSSKNKKDERNISDMIHGLQKGIVCLEKQRMKVLFSKKKPKKK